MSQPPSSTLSNEAGAPQTQTTRQPSRNRRGRSRTPRSVSVGSETSDSAPQQATSQRKNRRRGGNKSGLPAVEEVEDRDRAVAKAPANQQPQQPPAESSGGGGAKDTLRLRLDLNLEIEVTIKAKIHGDLTLSLL